MLLSPWLLQGPGGFSCLRAPAQHSGATASAPPSAGTPPWPAGPEPAWAAVLGQLTLGRPPSWRVLGNHSPGFTHDPGCHNLNNRRQRSELGVQVFWSIGLCEENQISLKMLREGGTWSVRAKRPQVVTSSKLAERGLSSRGGSAPASLRGVKPQHPDPALNGATPSTFSGIVKGGVTEINTLTLVLHNWLPKESVPSESHHVPQREAQRFPASGTVLNVPSTKRGGGHSEASRWAPSGSFPPHWNGLLPKCQRAA